MASWNKLTYPSRLFLWLLCYSALLVACFVAFQYEREKEFKIAELNSQLQIINNYILNELHDGKDVDTKEIDTYQPFTDLRITIIDKNGEVLYDNALDSIPHSNHLSRAEICESIKTGNGYAVRRHSESTGGEYFYSAMTDKNGITVRTAVPYSVSLLTLLEADYGFIWATGSIAIVMCILGYFATKRLGKHIQRLSRFAKRAEKGERISDTESFPHDELGEISSHIVRLYSRLQQAYADRDREHRSALFEEKEKNRIKKQLTNNINHELKTPIASIQLCTETLLAHPNLSEDKRTEFLQRSLSATNRLRQLINDVSLITRMDEGSEAIVKESVNLTDIIREVVADRSPIAESKGIKINNDISEPIIMDGNQSLLASIFNNIIDNAIAYSGGTEIVIKQYGLTQEKIHLFIADNGSGIPDEHLPKLFERFYRIDKGRSRAAGGTGLGLSIVKNAVHMHGGEIRVENRRQGGLAFHIGMRISSIDV